jgi:RNA polymerase sigma-70 factor (ECF subfamily)
MEIEKESKIIRRILCGEPEAYALLIDQYKAPVYNLVLKLTDNREDAEDLAQEIFIRAFEALDRFDIRKRFFPWLYTIALNMIRNHHKKKKPLLMRNFEALIGGRRTAEVRNPEHMVQSKQAAQMLDSCIRKLPLPQKEAVVLRYYQELTFEEIAQIQKIKISAAKMRVYRGLKHLSRIFHENNSNNSLK